MTLSYRDKLYKRAPSSCPKNHSTVDNETFRTHHTPLATLYPNILARWDRPLPLDPDICLIYRSLGMSTETQVHWASTRKEKHEIATL